MLQIWGIWLNRFFLLLFFSLGLLKQAGKGLGKLLGVYGLM